MQNLVVFDLDGTLNATHLYSVAAQRKALAEFGGSGYSDDELIACLGERPIDYARRLLPHCSEEQLQQYLARELYWEDKYMPERCGSFEGIPELLTRLRAEGYITAVCSNASLDYIDMALAGLGLTELIDHRQQLLAGLTKNDTLALLLGRVPHSRAVMVGDRRFDLLAARHNGIPFIGCLYGYGRHELTGADYLAATAADIYTGVTELMGR